MRNWFKTDEQQCRDKFNELREQVEKLGLRYLEYQTLYDRHPTWKIGQKEEFGKLIECSRLLWGYCNILSQYILKAKKPDNDLASMLVAVAYKTHKLDLHLDALFRMAVGLAQATPIALEVNDIECPHEDICEASDERLKEIKEEMSKE